MLAERRPEAGLRIERVGDRQGAALWRVVGTNPDPLVAGTDVARGGLVGFVSSSQPAEHGAQAGGFADEDAGRQDRDDTPSPESGENAPPNPPNSRAPHPFPDPAPPAAPPCKLTQEVIDLFDGTLEPDRADVEGQP